MSINIVYEDNHLIVLNKKSKELVQSDITGDQPLLEKVREYLKVTYNKPGNVYIGLPHRLDRPTSGLVVMSKTSKALSRLNDMFRGKDIQKTYWAVVKNRPPKKEGVLINYLKKVEKINKSFVELNDKRGAKYSELTYKVLASSDNYHLLEIKPKTGRHHQIRLQLSTINCPIKGDLKYGFQRSNPDGSIHLHARKLNLIHPVRKEPMEFVAPAPKEPLWQHFEQLVGDKAY